MDEPLALEPTGDAKRRARSPAAKAERAERLLEAAEELLGEGRALSTVADIATRAGVAKGTVYLYYQTKEEVYLSVLGRRLTAWAESLATSIRASSEPLDGELLAKLFLAYPVANPVTLRLAGLSPAVLEQNVSEEAALRFKSGQRDRLVRLGGALARVNPGVSAAEATQGFLRSYGYANGIWQLAEPPEICREAMEGPGLEELRVDFVSVATIGLTQLWRDLLG